MRLEVKGLVKEFPAPLFSGGAPLRALDGADLEADTGITGLGGANGSGKTTLFKTLAGILEADSGTILIGGSAASPERLRGIAAYCPANPRSFYFRLTASENLRFFGALAGLSPAEAAERAGKLAPRLGLSAADLRRRFDRLSEGNMQKISLIRALSRRAPILLLDEPFRGLDGIACRGLLELIAEAGRNSTVLVTSHSRELLAAAAARTLRIDQGRMPPGGPQ
jgi:ABC-2 type transport system ATP-binding protein